MDIKVTVTEIALDIAKEILYTNFLTKPEKRHPIHEWCYEIDLDKLTILNKEIEEFIYENMAEFNRLVNNSVYIKLNYLYAEGYTKKDKDYYYVLTDAEFKQQLEECLKY